MQIHGLTLRSTGQDNQGVEVVAFSDESQPEWRR
jgi:hypothetical protein